MTRSRPSLVPRLALAALAVLTGLAVIGPSQPAVAQEGATDQEGATGRGRVLVVSIPGVEWDDVAAEEVPALREFFADAALAGLAPRGVAPRSGPGDAYLTISAGARATTEPSVDGQVLAVDEESIGSRAGDIYARRTGSAPDGPLVALTWPTLVRVNAAEPYHAVLGSLEATLDRGGVSAAVVGNADGIDSIGQSYERQAGLALSDTSGVVPGGDMGRNLLSNDPSRPFGLQLDHSQVLAGFDRAWDAPEATAGGAVVLVEASDLARTLRYRQFTDLARYRQLWSQALADSDRLFGQLLERVDPERDTVLVVAPYNGRRDRDLTVVALRGPGTEAGYLRSASTQRPGFLTLVDIAPTILDRLDLVRPDDMEGRPAVISSSSRSLDGRISHLQSLNRSSRFRELLLDPTTAVAVVGMAVVVGLGMAAHANRWRRRTRLGIQYLALACLAQLPGSFLVRLFAVEDRGTGFYWALLLAFALTLPGVAMLAAHRIGRPRAALIGVLAVTAGVLVGDVVTGSNLSLSAAFGYSATGNSRLYGISNYSYGQLAGATCVIAAWVASVWPTRRGRLAAIGVMAAVLVVLGVPTWGSDVGGTLAFTPAVAMFVVVLYRRRIRIRTVVTGALATVLAIGVFGFMDLARPATERSHLGRLFERVGREGLDPLLSIVERKLLANMQVSTSSLWVAAIPVFVVLWVFLVKFPDRPRDRMQARFRTLSAGLAAALVAAGLGSALNDSGAIIGGIMAMVVACVLVSLLMEGSPPDPLEAMREEPDPPR